MLGKTLLIPVFAFGLVGAATAAETPRQCPTPWSKASAAEPAGSTCRVGEARGLRQLSIYKPDSDAPHLLTKAEIRAELDAIRIAPATQFASTARRVAPEGRGGER